MGISVPGIAEHRADLDGIGPGLLFDADERGVHDPDRHRPRRRASGQERLASMLGDPGRPPGVDGRRRRQRDGTKGIAVSTVTNTAVACGRPDERSIEKIMTIFT